MPFISNGVYTSETSDSSLVIDNKLYTFSNEFCINRLYNYEVATLSYSYNYPFYEEPYFVYGNDFYTTGMIGDLSKRNDYNIRFSIYHFDSKTYTDGVIPIPWVSDSSSEDPSNRITFYMVILLEMIEDLKFYALIVRRYMYSSSNYINAMYSCVIDYKNLTATKISDISSQFADWWVTHPSTKNQVILTSYNAYNYVYKLNTNDGSYTEITTIESNHAPAYIGPIGDSDVVSCISGYPYYPSNNYRMVWRYIPDIRSSSYKSIYKTKSNNWISYNRDDIETCDDSAAIIPAHIRSNLPLFLFMDAYTDNPQCTIAKIDKIDVSTDSEDDYMMYITHLGNFTTLVYSGNMVPYTNMNEDCRNFTARSSYIRPPYVVDYSKENTMWGMPISGYINNAYTVWRYPVLGYTWNTPISIMSFTIKEDEL